MRILLTAAIVGTLWGGMAGAQVEDVAGWVGEDGVARVRWTTPEPTRGRVEYGATTDYGAARDEDPSSLRGTTNNREAPAPGYANNHRADLPAPADGVLHARVVVQNQQGKSFTSPDLVLRRPAPKTQPGANRVALIVDRGAWTKGPVDVVAGIPFGPGRLGDVERVRVTAGGKEVACQPEVVSRHVDDGSVRWLRVAFQAPEGAGDVALEYGAGVKRAAAAAMAARVEGTRAAVGGDALRVEMDENGVARVTGAGAAAVTLAGAALVGGDGKTYTARPESVTVEESGPVRTVVAVRGRHASAEGGRLFGYVLRVYVFAGRPFARMDYTLENDNLSQDMTSFRSLELKFRGAGAAAVETDTAGLVLGPGRSAFQREDFEWVDETGRKAGRRLPGVARLGQARVMAKDFWAQYPKAMSADADTVTVGLAPPLPAGFYAKRPDEDKLYFYLRDGAYTLRQGVSKTHEMWVDLSGGMGAALIGDRPTACAAPEWIEASGGMRGLGVAAREQFPGYDKMYRDMAAAVLAEREARREYGLMNFGDWYGERTWNWGNLEYDMGHSMLTQFARTGDGVFFRRAEEAVRHQGDVDTRRMASDPKHVGQQWIHSVGHTAGYYPPSYKNMKIYASPGWSDNRGHVWSQGLLEHYLFGGDRRSWEAGILIADWAAGPQTTNFTCHLAREPGWMLRIVMSGWLATGDPYYLNGARLMVRVNRRRSEETGGRGFFFHELSGGHCRCAPKKHSGEAGFMLATLMSGLKMYYEATGDESVAEDIVKMARFIHETMWVEEACLFRGTSCPNSPKDISATLIQMEGMAFAAARTRDAALARMCQWALAAAWGTLGHGGKTVSFSACASAQAIHEYARIPGVRFSDYMAGQGELAVSPARRLLPTMLNNPDFEETAAGWPPRGGRVTRDTTVKRSGQASLRFEGNVEKQGEFFNTQYDTFGAPEEITGMEPGRTYRMTLWMRVDRLSAGAPKPSVRVALRDASGTRTARASNAYDTSRMGEWQKLTCDVETPDWRPRAYIAINTNTPAPVEALLYVDDVSLTPVEAAKEDTFVHIRLDPSQARAKGLEARRTDPPLRQEILAGAGEALYEFALEQDRSMRVWARTGKGGVEVAVDGQVVGAAEGGRWAWRRVGVVALKAGAHQVRVSTRDKGAEFSRIVLTDDPSEHRERTE